MKLQASAGRCAVIAATMLALLGGDATPAAAEAVSDAQGSFQIVWPDDWTPGSDPAYVEAFAPAPPAGVNCFAEAREEPGIAMTQEQINQELAAPVSDADFKALVGAEELQSITEKSVRPGAVTSQRGTVLATMQDLTVIKGRLAFFVLPGRVLTAGCFARAPDFPLLREQFETILDSFQPR